MKNLLINVAFAAFVIAPIVFSVVVIWAICHFIVKFW